MKKHRYRAKKASDINWNLIKEKLAGSAAVLAIDLVKEKQYDLLSILDNSILFISNDAQIEAGNFHRHG